MSFGTRLTIIRKEYKMSQSDLTQKAGIRSNVLERYKWEAATPSVEVAAKIVDVLGASLDGVIHLRHRLFINN